MTHAPSTPGGPRHAFDTKAASPSRPAGYEAPRLLRIDLDQGNLDLGDGKPILAQGAPSSPNVSGVTVFGGPPPSPP